MDENKAPQEGIAERKGLKELDLVVILILIGLLAIAIFIWLFFGGGASSDDVVDTGLREGEVTNESMTSENFEDYPGRNEEVLGIAVHAEHGRYFTNAENDHTLYVQSAPCEECENNFLFVPFVSSVGPIEDGDLTVQEIPRREQQFVWKGEPLYTYSGDLYAGSVKGLEVESSSFELARP